MAQNINVDITPSLFQPTLNYSQGDIGRQFTITVVSKDGYSIPSGATAVIQATKPSGFGFSVEGTVSENTVSFSTTAEMTDEWGRFPAELKITSGATVLFSANFLMVGEKNTHPEGTIDGSQGTIIPELTLLVERVETAASNILDMNVVANTLPAGSSATYEYDEETNTATFGVPQGEAGGGTAGVVAPAYDASKTYAVGDFVIHDSKLYKCTTAITTAEAWTAAHWTQVVMSGEVTDLKSDLNRTDEIMGRSLVKCSLANGTISNPSNAVAVNTNYVAVNQGDTATCVVNKALGAGESYQFAYALYDSTKTLISQDTTALATNNKVVITNATVKYVRFAVFKYDGANYVALRTTSFAGSENVSVNITNPNGLIIDAEYAKAGLDSLVNSVIKGQAKNFINGFHADNALWSNFSNSPFVINKKTEEACVLKSIKLKSAARGYVTVSYTVDEVSAGEECNRDSFVAVDKIFITSTGSNTVSISSNIVIPKGAYIAVGLPENTSAFNYGSYGSDKGFFYVNNNGEYVLSNNSLGVDIDINVISFDANIDSIYNGKSLSILGDSISTFSGYIPAGNETYYPYGDVLAVTDTWWKKLIDALGLELNVNNSWSGSRVTTTNGDTSAGCMTRCQNLGTNPDVIVVWMGINDFINEVGLGTYDGTTALPVTTTTFREAYAIMLNKILTAYPMAEVWVCTLTQCERDGSRGFPEINGNGVALPEFNKAIKELAEAFGVKVLDHNKSGLTYQNMAVYDPNELHPNKLGHSLIANNDIRQMDNAVRVRY